MYLSVNYIYILIHLYIVFNKCYLNITNHFQGAYSLKKKIRRIRQEIVAAPCVPNDLHSLIILEAYKL